MLYASIAERRRRSSIPNGGREIGGALAGLGVTRKKSSYTRRVISFLGIEKERECFCLGMLKIERGSPSTLGLHEVNKKHRSSYIGVDGIG